MKAREGSDDRCGRHCTSGGRHRAKSGGRHRSPSRRTPSWGKAAKVAGCLLRVVVAVDVLDKHDALAKAARATQWISNTLF